MIFTSNFILWGQGEKRNLPDSLMHLLENQVWVLMPPWVTSHTHICILCPHVLTHNTRVDVHMCTNIHGCCGCLDAHTCMPPQICTQTYVCGFLYLHVHIYTHTGPCGGSPHPPPCFKQPRDTGLRRRKAVCFTCGKLAQT